MGLVPITSVSRSQVLVDSMTPLSRWAHSRHRINQQSGFKIVSNLRGRERHRIGTYYLRVEITSVGRFYDAIKSSGALAP